MTNNPSTSSSWFQWIKTPYHRANSTGASSSRIETTLDPFAIPADYTWISAEAKKKKMQEKNKSKKGRSQSKNE
ncbi:ankyrin repeat domain-containing protein 13C-B [Tanacetum coccineum]